MALPIGFVLRGVSSHDAASRVLGAGPVTAPGCRFGQIGHNTNFATGRSALDSTVCSMSGIMTLAMFVHASRKLVFGRPKRFNVSRVVCAEHRGGRNSVPGNMSDNQAELERLREEVTALREQAQAHGESNGFPRPPAVASSEYAAWKIDSQDPSSQEALALLTRWAVVPECTRDQHSIMQALWETIKENEGVPTNWTIWAIAPTSSGIQGGLHTSAPCLPQALAMVEAIDPEKNVIHHLISNPAKIGPGLRGAVIEFLKSAARESNFKNPMELETFGICTFEQEQRRIIIQRPAYYGGGYGCGGGYGYGGYGGGYGYGCGGGLGLGLGLGLLGLPFFFW